MLPSRWSPPAARHAVPALLGMLGLVLTAGCERERSRSDLAPSVTAPAATTSQAPPHGGTSAPPSTTSAPAVPPSERRAVVLAGGDVSFGQLRGQELLRNPQRDDFAQLRGLLARADLRFVNLESQLSEQAGETVSPDNHLVFTGPPSGADALARGGIDVVSLANNHAWDYGRKAFLETLANLERVHVAYVGAGRTEAQARAPLLVERAGVRIALLAATDIWNQGSLARHEAKGLVVDARSAGLVEQIRRVRASAVDFVLVSVHLGDEYVDTPRQGTIGLLRTLIDAGADAVIGHHPHVTQRVELRDGRPIFYSLGNLLMRMASGHDWTELGLVARLELVPGARVSASVCPVRIAGLDAIALASDPRRRELEGYFRARYEQLLTAGARADPPSGVTLGPFDDTGCAALTARR